MRKFVMLMLLLIIASVMAVPAFAQGNEAAAASTTNWIALTAGFAIALAAGLAAQGQGKVASAACEAMGRNPAAGGAIQVAMLLGLAFIESLVLFTFVMIFLKVK